MGWRFRQSFKVFPGVRLNLSGRGLSTTIGYGPASINISSRGAYANLNIPGTGLSYRQKISGGAGSAPQQQPGSIQFPTHPTGPAITSQKEEIRSAGAYELTSQGLQTLRQLLSDVNQEQQSLDAELFTARQDWEKKSRVYERWNKGILFKRILKDRFIFLEREAQEARAKLDELEEQRRLTCVAARIEMSEDVKPAFWRLYDAFSKLTQSIAIWDTLTTQRTDRVRERTTANNSIERTLVKFGFGQSGLVQCDWQTPCFGNANGGDLYLYPGFLLYRVSREAFAVIDCREVEINLSPCNFIEEDGIPPDSQVVGQTWKYANKNGGPDRRFSHNYQIPLALYGQMTLKSPSGLHEQYLISNHRAAEEFMAAWQVFRAAISNVTP